MDTTGVTSSANQGADNHWLHNHDYRRGGTDAPGNDWGYDHEGDKFTPSSGQNQNQGNAADAGLFSVSEVVLFAAAAAFVLAQPPSPQTDPATAGSQSTANSPSTTSADSGAAASTGSQGNASPTAGQATSSVQPTTSDPTTTTAASDPTSTAASGTATDSTASDSSNVLQGLNNALAALGLNQQEIQVFDQVAQLIQGISPTAFNDIVSEIEGLAQEVSQASPTSGSQNVATGSSPDVPSSTDNAESDSGNSAAAGPSASSSATTDVPDSSDTAESTQPSASNDGSSTQGGTVQVEEVSFQFIEVQVQGQGNTNGSANGDQGTSSVSNSPSQGGNSTASSTEFVAFRLQIEEITATLTSNGSQAAQGQSSSQSTGDSSSGTSQASQPAAA